MSDLINLATQDRILTIQMNRPDKKNALTLDMYTIMAGAMRAGRVPEARVYLLLRALDPSGRGVVDGDRGIAGEGRVGALELDHRAPAAGRALVRFEHAFFFLRRVAHVRDSSRSACA